MKIKELVNLMATMDNKNDIINELVKFKNNVKRKERQYENNER